MGTAFGPEGCCLIHMLAAIDPGVRVFNLETGYQFLETLAMQRCMLVPPWIIQTRPDGSIRRLTRLVYTIDGELDKARMLINVARLLRRRTPPNFGPRFSV